MQKGKNVFLQLEEDIAYYSNCQLRGCSITKLDGEWRVMLKVTTTKGQKKVSFTTAPLLEDCFYLIEQALTTKSITLSWKDDRY